MKYVSRMQTRSFGCLLVFSSSFEFAFIPPFPQCLYKFSLNIYVRRQISISSLSSLPFNQCSCFMYSTFQTAHDKCSYVFGLSINHSIVNVKMKPRIGHKRYEYIWLVESCQNELKVFYNPQR